MEIKNGEQGNGLGRQVRQQGKTGGAEGKTLFGANHPNYGIIPEGPQIGFVYPPHHFSLPYGKVDMLCALIQSSAPSPTCCGGDGPHGRVLD